MRGVGAGSNYRQTKNRYITITSVSPDTLVDHKRHTQEQENYTLHTRISRRNLCFGVWVWEGLSGGCRAGLTIERCSQLAFVAISRPTETRWRYGWLRMVFTRCASLELAPIWCHHRNRFFPFGALREAVVRALNKSTKVSLEVQ